MKYSLKHTLWFYTGADYLIINAFLWRDRKALEQCLEIVWNNNRGVISEAEEQTPQMRFPDFESDAENLYHSYCTRTPEAFTDDAKAQMVAQIAEDIRCICNCMQRAGAKLHLIRNIDRHCMLNNVNIGETVELLGLTSTSTTGQLIDYSCGNYRKPEQILHIYLEPHTPCLVVQDSEENEVILPPMAYRVMDKYQDNGIESIVLQALEPLKLDALISESEAVWREGHL